MSRPILTITDDGKIALTVSQESLTDEERGKFVAFGDNYRRLLGLKALREREQRMKRAEAKARRQGERARKMWLR